MVSGTPSIQAWLKHDKLGEKHPIFLLLCHEIIMAHRRRVVMSVRFVEHGVYQYPTRVFN